VKSSMALTLKQHEKELNSMSLPSLQYQRAAQQLAVSAVQLEIIATGTKGWAMLVQRWL
jgi:hypothetical protein